MARRFKQYAKRTYGRARSGLNISPTFLMGVAAGYSDVDKKIPAELVLLGATAPVKGYGKVKGVCQGAVFGNTLKSLVAKKGFSGTSAGGLL